nr:serine protease [Streptomyces sp. SID3343]
MRQIRAAVARYRGSRTERIEIDRRRAAGMRFPDEEEQLALRAARLLERHEVPAPALLATAERESAPTTPERIIGVSNDLQSVNFLARGVRAAASVARIWYATSGPVQPQATGFLVSPTLLLTNHHVFPDADTARGAFAEFGAEMGIDNELPTTTVRFTPDPDTLYVTDPNLDFALVALHPHEDDGRRAGELFGHIQLIAAAGKLVVGDPVNMVGHPDGRLKEIAIRQNRFTQRFDDFLQYETDTEPGNSGSPVFNDQWEAVALHHSGVPAHDDAGNILNVHDQPWQPEQGQGAIKWLANEGVRVSVILRRLAELPLGEGQRALLAEMGSPSGLDALPARPPVASAVPSPRIPVAVAAGSERVSPVGPRGRPGAFGGRVNLVFLHGRGQQANDPTVLRRTWAAGLNRGLTMAALPTVDPEDVWFPFYGSRLVEVMETVSGEPTPIALSPSGRALYGTLLDEAAHRAGMPTEEPSELEGLGDVVGVMREPLGWLAAHTGVDRAVVAAAFKDVAAYLDEDATRDAVLDRVLETMPGSGAVVVVAHSLGTVVAMDLLTRIAPAASVAGLVTVGSPLGMDTVYSRLRFGGPRLPTIAGPWVNAWCPTDAIAIGCPLADDWSGLAAEVSVANPRDRSHDIGEYLSHPEVAGAIGRLLG